MVSMLSYVSATLRSTRTLPLPGRTFGGFIFGAFGHFLIRRAKNRHSDNRYAPENFEHMAEKISLRYVEIRGLFGFRCT